MLWIEGGKPIFKILDMWFLSGFDNKFISWNKSNFLASYKKTKVTMIWAIMVARAAPMTLRLQTKIKTGSKIRFKTKPVVVAIKVFFEWPAAVKIPVKIWFTNEKIIKPHVIHR